MSVWRQCQAKTAAGAQCGRKALKGSDFCGLKSHQPISDAPDANHTRAKIKNLVARVTPYLDAGGIGTPEGMVAMGLMEIADCGDTLGQSTRRASWARVVMDALRMLEARKELDQARRVVIEGDLDASLPTPDIPEFLALVSDGLDKPN